MLQNFAQNTYLQKCLFPFLFQIGRTARTDTDYSLKNQGLNMCGFAGIFAGHRQSESKGAFELLLEKMGKTLNHRGPDGNDIWADRAAGIGLSHRRLAILDLSSSGSQPMSSACGRYVMVYNGEIYNFSKVRSVLEKEGTVFKGTSDSEVLVESISRWGMAKSLEQFNGMFAFAIWDRKKRELIFARDRIGKKPLYYGWAGNSFVFASSFDRFFW